MGGSPVVTVLEYRRSSADRPSAVRRRVTQAAIVPVVLFAMSVMMPGCDGGPREPPAFRYANVWQGYLLSVPHVGLWASSLLGGAKDVTVTVPAGEAVPVVTAMASILATYWATVLLVFGPWIARRRAGGRPRLVVWDLPLLAPVGLIGIDLARTGGRFFLWGCYVFTAAFAAQFVALAAASMAGCRAALPSPAHGTSVGAAQEP